MKILIPLMAVASVFFSLLSSSADAAQAICANPDLPGFNVTGQSVQTLIDQNGASKSYTIMICGCEGNGGANLVSGAVMSTIYVGAGACAVADNVNAVLIQVKGAGSGESLSGVFKLELSE